MNLFFGILALVLLGWCVYYANIAYKDDDAGSAIFYTLLGTINFSSAIINLSMVGQ